ncbi:MAG: hypothetical protein EBZ34_04255, partial [Flavobacteriia bacterium]|nr:hypothetical protein [Flavobacteriia bacterium]
MKKIFAAALVLVALVSCKKDPTLADRLEGTWLVNDIIASGQISFGGQNIPLVANDKDIARARANGMTEALIDRLALSPARV